jgi:hypothetical protein
MTNCDVEGAAWAPAACTLPTAERPLRAAEFSAFFAASLREIERVDRSHLRLVLVGHARVAAAAAELTARETECCSFFDFTITELADRVVMDIAVPASYSAVLDGLARQAGDAAGLAR